MTNTDATGPKDLTALVSRCFDYLRSQMPSGGKLWNTLLLIGLSPFGESFLLTLPFESTREKHSSLAYGRAVFDIEGVDVYVALSLIRLFKPSAVPGEGAVKPSLLAVAADRARSYTAIAEVSVDKSGTIQEILPPAPVTPDTGLVSDVLTSLLRDEFKLTADYRNRVAKNWMTKRPTACFRFK